MRIHVFDAGGHRVAEGLGDAAVGAPGTLVWCDVRQPAAGDLTAVQARFALHALSLEDARKHGQRPKFEPFPPAYGLLVAYAFDPGATDDVAVPEGDAGGSSAGLVSTPAEVDVFLGDGWAVTVHRGDADVFDVAALVAAMGHGPADAPTVGWFARVLLDPLVDRYVAITDALGRRVDVLEGAIFGDEDPELHVRDRQRALHGLRADLLHVRRRAAPLADAVASLARDTSWVDDAARPYLRDVADHLRRCVEDLDLHLETVGHTVDAFLALVANHQNDVMKKMTSWGAILIVSTLIAGIYGMNFQHMPELHWAYGYPMALGMMVVATIGLRAWFNRHDWLSPPGGGRSGRRRR